MNISPCWVHVPGTTREIDVAPLLTVLDQFDAPLNAPLHSGASLTLTRVIRLLNVTVHDGQITSPIDLANLYRDLHRLEDALNALQDRPMN